MERDREYDEVKDALTSLVTCSIVSHAIRHAYVKVCDIKEGPVILTKQELMQDIKRDFHFIKGSQYRRASQRYSDDILSDSQYRRDEYKSSFFRDYTESSVRVINQTIQPHLKDYQHIRSIDLSGQLQHNSTELLTELIGNIAGCPIEVLVLSNNAITDDGLKILASKIRSFRCLHTLYLNHNQFGDDGIEALFHNDYFSSTLRILNIAYNKLGKTSAWSIGRMFTPGRIAELEELYIGGQVNYHHSIDTFFISLIPHILYPGARKLKKLDISSSGLSLDGISALITLIAWTTSIETLNMSQLAIEPSKYRHQFILALLMNKSLRQIQIHACGYRLSEMRSIEWFISSRHLPNFDITSFIFSSYMDVHWTDQIEYLQHIVSRRTILEQKRIKEENDIIEAKYTPPPILRPVLQTKNQDSLLGGGVTSVEKASKYLTLDEIAKLNPLSIASRSRRSVCQIQRAPPIVERYRYPLTILTGLQLKLSKEFQKKEHEIMKKEEKHSQLQRSRSSILIHKDTSHGTILYKPQQQQQTHEKRYQKYTKNTSSKNTRNEQTAEQKSSHELLKYYSELAQHTTWVTVQMVYTNLEIIYLKFFIYNKIKKEIIILNTPHQYAHYVTEDNQLYRTTLMILRLLKEGIGNEEEMREERRRGQEIKRKINCELIQNERKKWKNFKERNEEKEEEKEEEEKEDRPLGMKEIGDGDDENGERGVRGDGFRKIIEKRGIGREEEYHQEKKCVEDLLRQKDRLIKKYGDHDNYRGIFSPSRAAILDHIFIDRDPSMCPKSHSFSCLFDYYVEYRQRYLTSHLKYIHLTDLIVQELEECFLLCQSLSGSVSIPATPFSFHDDSSSSLPPSLLEEECLIRMKGLEMMFQELFSLQFHLMTIIQIIHSILIAIEMTYYENIYQFSQSNPLLPSNLSSSTTNTNTARSTRRSPSERRKLSFSFTTTSDFTSYLRQYNPSCPISSTYLIRCMHPSYALAAIYLGYFFLSQEVESRFKETIPETSKSRPNSSRPIRQKEEAISYKSLLSLEETSVSSGQTSSRNTDSVSNRKPFNPKKGRKMLYPTKKELKEKQILLENERNQQRQVELQQQQQQQQPQQEQQQEEEEEEEEEEKEEEESYQQESSSYETMEGSMNETCPLGGDESNSNGVASLPSIQTTKSAASKRSSQSKQRKGSNGNDQERTSEVKTSLPPIPLSSRTMRSGNENERDDISALTLPEGEQFENISSRIH